MWLLERCTAPSVILVDLAARRSLVDYSYLREEIASRVQFLVPGEQPRTDLAGVPLKHFELTGTFDSVPVFRRASENP